MATCEADRKLTLSPNPISLQGPILKYNTAELTGNYQTWSDAVGKAEASVAVMYVSDYGFSDQLSQAFARGVTKTDTLVEMVNPEP